MKYVLFDFNGTIVDDIDVSIECLNHCIEKYLDRGPIDKEEYLKIFTFPVKKYYENAGFDFDVLDWPEVGQCWMDYYVSHRQRCKVHDGVVDFLIRNHRQGNKNVCLSASMIDNLKAQLKELEIYDYFDYILGIDNIYASSKIPIAKEFLKDKNPDDCLVIGDTTHDAEVAKEIGVRCVLVAKGHQNREILKSTGNMVYDDISEVIV